MYAEANKQLTCGEFCYLPATLCPFPEKVASQNSTQKKDTKWATKRVVKKKTKGKNECKERVLKQIPSLKSLKKLLLCCLQA